MYIRNSLAIEKISVAINLAAILDKLVINIVKRVRANILIDSIHTNSTSTTNMVL